MSSAPTAENRSDSDTNSPSGLVARVYRIPLIQTAIWAYEQGKASSRVVKCGAEMMEFTVNAILTPLIHRLPLNQLDQFVCSQLDKLEKFHQLSIKPVDKNVQKWLQVPGMKPGMAPVPVIPDWITGRSVYGHIITDAHRDHFRRMHPDVDEWQSSDHEALVSVASVIYHEAGYDGATTKVYDQGHWHICLIHVDHRVYYPNVVSDWRQSKTFMATLENALGITGEPKWYPCYSPQVV